MVTIENLSVEYEDGTFALRAINLKVHDGDSIAILGENGAGKTTLFYTMLGLLKISDGKILVNDIELSSPTLKQIRSQIGLVFQNPDDQLFMPTVEEDIAFGLRNYGKSEEEINKKIRDIAERLGIVRLLKKAPYKLSGGEKRLAALSTVLAMEPQAILFDEPSSFLDPRSRRTVINLLKEIRDTKMIATHDIDLAWELCDRAIILSKGEVVAEGSIEEILKNENLLMKYGFELTTRSQTDRRF